MKTTMQIKDAIERISKAEKKDGYDDIVGRTIIDTLNWVLE